MSAAALSPAGALHAPAGAARFAPPAALVVFGAWAATCLLLSATWGEGFLWAAGIGFAVTVLRPFMDGFRRGFDAFEVLPLFTLYYALSLLLRGVGVLTFVDSPYLRELGDARTAHLRELVAWTFFHSALGMAALYAAYHSAWARGLGAKLVRAVPALVAPWRGARLPWVVGTLVVLGLAAATLRVGGPAGFLSAATNPMKTGTEDALGRWWMIALTEFSIVGYHVHMVTLLLRGDRRFTAKYLALGLALGGPLYLVSSSKFVLLRIFLLPWVYRHFVVRRVSMGHVLVGFTAFGALFPFFYAYRVLGVTGMANLGRYLDRVDHPFQLIFNRSYGTDSFALILHRTGVTLPFQWGHSLLDLFVFWIPRALWPGKPDSFGLVFPATYMPDMHWGNLTYASCSLPGELYLNFHVPGIVVGMALLGAAMRAAFDAAGRGPGAVLLYGYVLVTAMHLVEGCIASQLETCLTHLIPLALALAALTCLPRRRTA